MTVVTRNRKKFKRQNLAWWRLVRFWSGFAWETLNQRRLQRLVELRQSPAPLIANGLENLPLNGSFVLAINHYNSWHTIDVLAAVMRATGQQRPDLTGKYLVVAGLRQRKSKRAKPALLNRLLLRVFKRWENHLLHVALGNERSSIKALREWRNRVKVQPALVFPEGKASRELGYMRPGAGRWLRSLGVPVVPVGVWWENDCWHIRFGAPVNWSARPELSDIQLGLNIATLLPNELNGRWQQGLQQWQAVHTYAHHN